jgi:hypothetical protein
MDPTTYTADPGVRYPNLYPGYATQTSPTGGAVATGGSPVYPGAIPVRRLFQVPDANVESNAGEPGDSFINNQEPTPPATILQNPPPPPALGALPPITVQFNGTPVPFAFNQGYPNLVWSIWPGNNFPSSSGAPVTSVGLSQPSDPSSTQFDARQHPSWRVEMLQRVMNLTTVRTHQYAAKTSIDRRASLLLRITRPRRYVSGVASISVHQRAIIISPGEEARNFPRRGELGLARFTDALKTLERGALASIGCPFACVSGL